MVNCIRHDWDGFCHVLVLFDSALDSALGLDIEQTSKFLSSLAGVVNGLHCNYMLRQ